MRPSWTSTVHGRLLCNGILRLNLLLLLLLLLGGLLLPSFLVGL